MKQLKISIIFSLFIYNFMIISKWLVIAISYYRMISKCSINNKHIIVNTLEIYNNLECVVKNIKKQITKLCKSKNTFEHFPA
jgi:hypothetical protein